MDTNMWGLLPINIGYVVAHYLAYVWFQEPPKLIMEM